MSKCKMCHVEILDESDTCPLCRNVLENHGKAGKRIYPDVRTTTKKYKLLENIVLFVSIVLCGLLFFIDSMTAPKILWSFTAALAIAYANIMLRLTILGKQTYMTKILWSILIGLAFLIEADVLTGNHGWGFNYALPAAIAIWDIAVLFLMLCINRKNWQSYIIDQLTALFACAVMAVLVAAGVVTKPQYAMGVLVFTILLFLGTIIIGDRKARTELKRRFHI